MSSGIPVITWSQAAIADFIKQHNVGIVIDDLNQIDDVLANVTKDQYLELKHNAEDLATKLRDGFYTKTAFRKVEDLAHQIIKKWCWNFPTSFFSRYDNNDWVFESIRSNILVQIYGQTDNRDFG